MVGVEDPASGSTVTANALASIPAGNGGLITMALPCGFGLNIPAGMGAPFIGISHSSYAFCDGGIGILLARKIKLPRSLTYITFPCGWGGVFEATNVTVIASVAVRVATMSWARCNSSRCWTVRACNDETSRCRRVFCNQKNTAIAARAAAANDGTNAHHGWLRRVARRGSCAM